MVVDLANAAGEILKAQRVSLALAQVLGLEAEALGALDEDGLQAAVEAALTLKQQEFRQSQLEQILRTPIEVTLGNKTYDVRRLPMAKDEAWRRRVQRLLRRYKETVHRELADDVTSLQMGTALQLALMTTEESDGPDDLVELMFDYAPELAKDRARIMDECSREEVLQAAEIVFDFFTPYFRQLARTAARLQALMQET